MSKVHTYSKHGVWKVCKGRHCAPCRPVYVFEVDTVEACDKSIGLGRHKGVGYCMLPKGHDGYHLARTL